MGVLDSLGIKADIIPNFSLAGISSGISIFLIVIVVLVGVGGFTFFHYYRQFVKKQFKYTTNLFKEVNGKIYWITGDTARELKIPRTNVRIFYWKKNKFYSAFPTREMGFNIYSYKINRFGELTNFDLNMTEKEGESATIDYDHRDQTYAYLHLQQLINRNYRDKNKNWIKENLPLIAVIITSILMLIAMWFFFRMSGNQMNQWTIISTDMKESARLIANALQELKNINSGIVS